MIKLSGITIYHLDGAHDTMTHNIIGDVIIDDYKYQGYYSDIDI
jgi:hypothetical protein